MSTAASVCKEIYENNVGHNKRFSSEFLMR